MVCYLCGLLPGTEAVASFTKRTVDQIIKRMLTISAHHSLPPMWNKSLVTQQGTTLSKLQLRGTSTVPLACSNELSD